MWTLAPKCTFLQWQTQEKHYDSRFRMTLLQTRNKRWIKLNHKKILAPYLVVLADSLVVCCQGPLCCMLLLGPLCWRLCCTTPLSLSLSLTCFLFCSSCLQWPCYLAIFIALGAFAVSADPAADAFCTYLDLSWHCSLLAGCWKLDWISWAFRQAVKKKV